jgi:hypothetical protein
MIRAMELRRVGRRSAGFAAVVLVTSMGLSAGPASAATQTTHAIPGIETSIGCLTKNLCVAVGDTANGHGTVIAIKHGVGEKLDKLHGTGSGGLFSISCPSAKGCVALGTSSSNAEPLLVEIGRAGKVVGTKKLKAPLLVDFDRISCSSTTSCVLVGSKVGATPAQVVVGSWNGRKLTTHSVRMHGASGPSIEGLSCFHSSCLAVGTVLDPSFVSVIVSIHHGKPSKPVKVPVSSGLQAVSCVSNSVCYAVGFHSQPAGVIVTVKHGKVIRHAVVATSAFGIACDKSSCTVVGEELTSGSQHSNSDYLGDVVSVKSGAPGTVAEVTQSGGYDSVARIGGFYEAVGSASTGPTGGNTGHSAVTSG